MSDDILTRIDDTLENASACFCGCQRPIAARSASPWFATEECQVRWNVRRITSKSSGEEMSEPAEAAAEPAPVATHLRRPRRGSADRDWPLHDHRPAEGDWPGGARYGYTRERVMGPRNWSEDDRALAARHGIELPELDWAEAESWWDLPRATIVEVEHEPVDISFFTDDPFPVRDISYRQVTRNAKKYGKHHWLTDPLAAARRAEVDLRRRIEDGTAPAPDRVTEAFRAEVLRQGRTEYEEGGVRWEYADGTWRAWRIEALRPQAGEVHRLRAEVTIATPEEAAEATRRHRSRSLECGALTKSLRCSGCDGMALEGGGLCLHDCHGTFMSEEQFARCVADQPEPVSPLIGAALDAEVEIHRYECPHARCDWAKVALDRDVLLDLAEAHELEKHARPPWWNWKRWTR